MRSNVQITIRRHVSGLDVVFAGIQVSPEIGFRAARLGDCRNRVGFSSRARQPREMEAAGCGSCVGISGDIVNGTLESEAEATRFARRGDSGAAFRSRIV